MKCFLRLVPRPVQLTYFLSQRLAWLWSNRSCAKCPPNHLLTCHSFLVHHSPVQGEEMILMSPVGQWLGLHAGSDMPSPHPVPGNE